MCPWDVACPCRSPLSSTGAALTCAGCHCLVCTKMTCYNFKMWDRQASGKPQPHTMVGHIWPGQDHWKPANAAGPPAANGIHLTVWPNSALTCTNPNLEQFHQFLQIFLEFTPTTVSHLLKKSLKRPKMDFLNATFEQKSCPKSLIFLKVILFLLLYFSTSIYFYFCPEWKAGCSV